MNTMISAFSKTAPGYGANRQYNAVGSR
jgi:hypothetical protein